MLRYQGRAGPITRGPIRHTVMMAHQPATTKIARDFYVRAHHASGGAHACVRPARQASVLLLSQPNSGRV